jgi:DNA-binding NarL/FixJ family response regulator
VSVGIAGVRIAILDDEMSTVDLSGLIRLGVHGFLSYQHLEKELGPALARLSRGELWFSTTVLEYYIKTTVQPDECKASATSLTPRQKQVMSMLRKGLSNKEIGAAMGISESTVKFHTTKIFDKLGVNDRRAILLLPQDRIEFFGLGGIEEKARIAS